MNDTDKQLVSCLILSYKKIPCLYSAIDSALMQDYPRMELLIGDDGTDAFPQTEIEQYICAHKGINLEKFTVCHHPQNIGTVRNINSLLQMAAGDIFMTLSGDDEFYDQTVFSRVVQRITETGTDLLACARMRCSEALEPIEVIPNEKQRIHIRTLDTAEKQFKAFITFDFSEIASGSAMYYTRAHIAQYGLFDEQYRLWEDGPRLTQYVQSGKMIPTAYDIVSIRYRDGGISNHTQYHSPAKKQLGEDHMRFIRLMLLPNKKGTNLKRRRRYISEYQWSLCNTRLQRVKVLLLYPEKGLAIARHKVKKAKNNIHSKQEVS